MNYDGDEIELSEEDGIKTIHIYTNEANIVVNGDLIWSPLYSPEYAQIPSQMREYIKNSSGLISSPEDDVTQVELGMKTGIATMIFSKDYSNIVSVKVDYISSVEEMVDFYMKDLLDEEDAEDIKNQLSNLQEEIVKIVIENNFKWTYSHKTTMFFASWNLEFNADDWDQEIYDLLIKKIDNFNQRAETLADAHGLGIY